MKKLLLMTICLTLAFSTVASAKTKKHDEDWYEEWGSQTVTMSDNNIILYLDGDKDEREFELTAEVEPNDEDLKWESSDTSVATVSSNGKVKAKKVGTCNITATGKESDRQGYCYVEVRSEPVPVTKAEVKNDGELTVTKTKTKKLPFKISPSNHTEVKYQFRVADTEICSVDSNGNVYGREEGETTVTMWFSNEEKGKSQWNAPSEEEAEFKLKFNVTVIDYDTEKLDKFSEKYPGFYSGTRQEVDEFIWINVNNVGWILYDGSRGDYVKGWQKVGGKSYYLKTDEYKTKSFDDKTIKGTFSVMQVGWLQENNKWYLLGADGAMKQGWAVDDGKWYYLDPATGEMKTGVVQIKDKWYYLREDGSAVQGWWHNPKDNEDYYADPVTCELPSTWFLVDGKWYYSDTFKFYAMKNQWVKDEEGNNYYLSETGEMLTNTTTPDGYTVGADGRWVQ